jgi:putative flippase GtrA
MKALLRQFKGQDHGPVVQFIKYGISGGAATAVQIVLFSAMACWVLPALRQDEWAVRLFGLEAPDIPDSVRALRAAINTVVAFVFSNLTAYLLNIFWVFKRGRHHWVLEVLYFYLVSGASMVIGTAIQSWLIAQWGLTTTVAFGANLVSSVMINYALRKFFIFKG